MIVDPARESMWGKASARAGTGPDRPGYPPSSGASPSAARRHFDAVFSFFFFCLSLIDTFGLLFFFPFSIPLAIVVSFAQTVE